MLLRVIGWLLVIEACMMLIPCIAGAIYGEKTVIRFLICVGITGAAGFLLMNLRPRSKEMGKREAIVLTAMTWVILSLFGMLPFIACGVSDSVTNAFFETMSGFTTTGATALTTLEGVPHSIILWRSVTQWVGGLGILLFTLAVTPMLNYSGGIQLFNAEVTGITHDKLQPRISHTAKGLWMVYIALTATMMILLSFSEMGFFNALCYSLSTLSTGGFTTSDAGIKTWDTYYIKIVLTVFMFLGGVNFALLFKVANKQWRGVFKNETLRIYCIVLLAASAIFAFNIWFHRPYSSIGQLLVDPIFEAASILSSTGITSPDFAGWGPIPVIILILMVISGACAGSTTGGAKIDRFIVLVKFLRNEFYRLMYPNAIRTVVINGQGTPPPLLMKTLAFLFLYFLVILAGAVGLILFGLNTHDALMCSLAAINNNTGLDAHITTIGGDYHSIADGAKWLLSFIMLTGRLELYTVLILFTRVFWKR